MRQVRERHLRLRDRLDLVHDVRLGHIQRACEQLVLGLPGRHEERERRRVVHRLRERLLLVVSRVRVHALRGGQSVSRHGRIRVRSVQGRLLHAHERVDLVRRVRRWHVLVRNWPDLVHDLRSRQGVDERGRQLFRL